LHFGPHSTVVGTNGTINKAFWGIFRSVPGEASLIFGMAILFVFLLLAAQYESWALPLAVLLCTPLVVLVSGNFDNNVYAQISLAMLIALAAKNVILIVEFAKLKHEEGKSIVEAALEGAKLRLRPILMTSFAFILGCVPLMLAKGSGAPSRGVMGTAVVYGMAIATFFGIFLIPVCFLSKPILARIRSRWAICSTSLKSCVAGLEVGSSRGALIPRLCCD
jgi:multidrug efflux pump subunit AcrB